MKKYIKPELYFESFTLSQHIADCALEWRNNVEVAGCHLVGDEDNSLGDILNGFTSTAACAQPIDEMYCYTNAVGMTFQS